MAKKPNDDDGEPLPADREGTLPIAGGPVKRKGSGYPVEDPVPTPTATCPPLPGQTAVGDPVRVLLTGDNRIVLHEAYIPEEAFGFRISVNGQFFEHVDDSPEGAHTWIFAPTR